MVESIDDVIYAWRMGHEKGLIPWKKEERINSYVNLLINLRELCGQTRDELRGNFLKAKIVRASVPPNAEAKKKRSWEEAAASDLEAALLVVCPIKLLNPIDGYEMFKNRELLNIPKDGSKSTASVEEPKKRQPKILDVTKIKDAPGLSTTVDDDRAKLLGFDDEELSGIKDNE